MKLRGRVRSGPAVLVASAIVVAGGFLQPGVRYRAAKYVHAVVDPLLLPPLGAQELGDGRPASELILCYPTSLARDSAGSVYVADRGRETRGRVVWRIDPDGTAHLLAGTGLEGSPTDGRASESKLKRPDGLAVDRRGNVYIADAFGDVVLRVDADGNAVRVVGTGRQGYSGDGGPAVHATLHRPGDIRFDSNGNLYIADVKNHRIRRVDPSGVITTVAGTGQPGYSPDGTLAMAASIDTPWGIGIDGEDRLLIADSENHLIRRVEHDGRLTTVAGTGKRGYSGDGGPAVDAEFDTPQAIIVDSLGRIIVGDEHNHVVRIIDEHGIVRTLVGTGAPGRGADGSVGTDAALNDPENLLILADGALAITDGANGRLLRVEDDGSIRVIAGGRRSCGVPDDGA